MFKFVTKSGLHRHVIIMKGIVIKVPRNASGVAANINEFYNFLKYSDIRRYLIPTYITFFGLVNVQAKADRISDINSFDIFFNDIRKKYLIEDAHPCFNDSKIENYGKYKGKYVKVDYGNDYWIYNIYIAIKNNVRTGRK